MVIHLFAVRSVSSCTILSSEFRLTVLSIEVDDPGNGDTLSATLYGQFDGDNTAEFSVKATCKITFSWPKSYGDIYYGEDNCMYDGESQAIPDADGKPVCCIKDNNLTDMVTNPYVVGGACKPH